MRIDKALENIRAVMEDQEIKWLGENGYDPVPHKAEPRLPSAPKKALSGHFAPNRFLGTAPTNPQDFDEPEEVLESAEHEEHEEILESAEHEEHEEILESEPEILEVIKPKDGTKHSWLYNEVVKAIRDAAGDCKNTKVIAVFIPVVQNGKEFEDLPVNETVELPPVDEEALKLEELPAIAEELAESHEELPESPEDLPEAEPADNVDEILPEPMHEPDAELEQAFINMEAKLDEQIAAENESTPEPEEEAPVNEEVPVNEPEESPEILPVDEPEAEPEQEQEQEQDIVIDGEPDVQETAVDVEESPEEFSAGEVMEFTELDTDIPLPNELDDEEVFDENKN